MHLDTFFTMGKSHKVCEDYAICKSDFITNLFAISDGCSSSIDTDIGSRILLKLLLTHALPTNPTYASFLWSSASHVIEQLGMPLSCLDATINFGYTKEINGIFGVEVITIGDGFIVAQRNDSGFDIIEIDYDQNAPYYLTYIFDDDRNQEFMKLNQTKKVSIYTYDSAGTFIKSCISDADDNTSVDKFSKSWFPLSDYKSISVFSDGLKTFINNDPSQPKMDFGKMVKELITFPVSSGEFVKRRGLSFIKKYKTHSFFDDFSMATLIRD